MKYVHLQGWAVLVMAIVLAGSPYLALAEGQVNTMAFIQVAPDNWTFEQAPGGERFIPFGSNLIITKPGGNNDQHYLDLLTGEKWEPELVQRAFEAARSLNMNVLKVFLPIWQTLPDPQPKGQVTLGAMEPPLLERLDFMFSVARETRVYVSLTLAEWGAHSLKWWQEGGTFRGRADDPSAEFDTYDTYRRFWTLIASRYKEEPALFSYNLAVEFYFPSGNWGAQKDDTPAYSHVLADRWGLPAWHAFLLGEYGSLEAINASWGTAHQGLEAIPQPSLAWVDDHYEAPQRMVADYGEFREQLVSAFLRNQTEALRAVDEAHMISCGFHPHHPAIGWVGSGMYLAAAAPAELDMLDYTTVHVYTSNSDYSPGVNPREVHAAELATRFAYGGKPVIVEEMGHINSDREETTWETIHLVETLAPHASGFMLWFLSDINPEKPYGPVTMDLELNSFGEAWRKLAEPGGLVAELSPTRAPAATTFQVDRLSGFAPVSSTYVQQLLEDWEGTPQPVDIILEGTRPVANGYFLLRMRDDELSSLRFDATGQGNYGPESIAKGQAIADVHRLRLEGPKLRFETGSEGFSWPLPFVREGYYDADTHQNYPEGKSTEGATPLVLPVRKFVASTGQTLFIESFKRLPPGEHPTWLNLGTGGTVWLYGDGDFSGVASVKVEGQTALYFEVGESFLRLYSRASKCQVEFNLFADASQSAAEEPVGHPTLAYLPEPAITCDLTGKSVAASPLASDLLTMAGYWHPGVIAGGEWLLDAVRTHWYSHPAAPYQQLLRDTLLGQLALIGYDRFEHFGMLFNWGCYPDYGAGGLLNLPANNGKYDMRMLHVNAMAIIAAAEYVLTTGDYSVLEARSARWVATDGDEAQPLCGSKAAALNYVLSAGDLRLDGKQPKQTYSLGQSFSASKPFGQVTLRLGCPLTNLADNWENKPLAPAVVEVFTGDAERLLASQEVALQVGQTDQQISVQLPEQAPPGKYLVRLRDPRSGKLYFGPALAWWTEPETDYQGGEAFWGPSSGTLRERLQCLFDYLYEYTGVRTEGLSYYPDDRALNGPDHKSGRPGASMQNSYNECLGGGYDAFMSLWWPAACGAMASLEELRGKESTALAYHRLEDAARRAYNSKYWHTVEENGEQFSRYFGSEDWDGVIHDYGFAYYNLEAAACGIPEEAQGQAILRWLDRGYWKPATDAPWQTNIYAPWQIAPPFNTVEIGDWTGVTGKLPYFEVLTNGGTRLMYEARDLLARRAYCSLDNAHERNEQVLARFANPDRLCGGRAFDDPGNRGRWHFGPPFNDRADIEGYREIFPGNGALASAQVSMYLGASFEAAGLRICPEVPATLEAVELKGLGFRGRTLDFTLRAKREPIAGVTAKGKPAGLRCWYFRPEGIFNKAQIQIELSPDTLPFSSGAQVSLALEVENPDGGWTLLARNWLSHARDGQVVAVRTEELLAAGRLYRLRLEELAAPEGCEVTIGEEFFTRPALWLERTSVSLRLHGGINEAASVVRRSDGRELSLDASGVEFVLEPGESLLVVLPLR